MARTSTKGTSYTAAQVTTQLNANSNVEQWKFDRLDSGLNYLTDLTPLVSYDQPPEIAYDSTAAVKRSIKIQLRGDAVFNPFQELIRAHYQLLMPDGGFIDWPLGTFLINPPQKTIQKGLTWRQLDGYDFGQFLVDGAFTQSYGVSKGSSVLGAIGAMVSSYGGSTPISINIPDPNVTIPANLMWDAGKTRLSAVNDLLVAVNYLPAWFDENGVMQSAPIPDYTTVQPSFSWDTTAGPSMVKSPIKEVIDVSKAYNQVTVIMEDPRRFSIAVTYVNNRADSPVSVPNWRPKAKLIRDGRIFTILAAYQRAMTETQTAARLYDLLTVETWPWALSQDRDVYFLAYSTVEDGLVTGNYIETKWQHKCRHGQPTVHTFDKIVAA